MLAKDFPTATEHDYQQMDAGRWQCTRCGHTVNIRRGGVCIGIPIYASGWDHIPDHLKTKTALGELGLRPAKDQPPAAAKMQLDRKGTWAGHYYALYDMYDAIAKRTATDAQLEALERGRYMAEKVTVRCSVCGDDIYYDYGRYVSYFEVTRKNYESNTVHYNSQVCTFCTDRQMAVTEARDWLESDALILDTETTGLDGAAIVEIAVINMKGEPILNQRIKPRVGVTDRAFNVHGISNDDLANAPVFEQVYSEIVTAIEGRTVLIYNVVFDRGILRDDCDAAGLPMPKFTAQDVMVLYAKYYGDWSSHYGTYKWQPLPYGNHSALGDAQGTLRLLQEIAAGTAPRDETV